MPRLPHEVEGDNGWSRWIPPIMRGYRMACCDCGLVHDMDFKAVLVAEKRRDGTWEYKDLPAGKYRVVLRARRNKRSTAAVRRHK